MKDKQFEIVGEMIHIHDFWVLVFVKMLPPPAQAKSRQYHILHHFISNGSTMGGRRWFCIYQFNYVLYENVLIVFRKASSCCQLSLEWKRLSRIFLMLLFKKKRSTFGVSVL